MEYWIFSNKLRITFCYRFKVLVMTLEEQVKDIKKILRPTQYIAFKEFPGGRVHARPYWKKQKSDVEQYGWKEYKEPKAPKAVSKKPETPVRTRKTTSKTKTAE